MARWVDHLSGNLHDIRPACILCATCWRSRCTASHSLAHYGSPSPSTSLQLRLDLKNPKADKSSQYFYFKAEEVSPPYARGPKGADPSPLPSLCVFLPPPPLLQVVARMRDVLLEHQEMPLSLAREASRVPGSSQVSGARGVQVFGVHQ